MILEATHSLSHFWMIGVTLGFAAGMAPGPMTALVVSETLRHGRGGGIRVSLAPLITDLPIVALALLAIGSLSGGDAFLGGLSMVGAVFVGWLGIQGMRSTATVKPTEAAPPRSLLKGVATNFLNPHPYLFWTTVGGPITIVAWRRGWVAAIGFVGMFYVFLIGTKVVLTVLVDRSRGVLSGRGYVWTNRLLGTALVILAMLLLRDGLRFLGIGG